MKIQALFLSAALLLNGVTLFAQESTENAPQKAEATATRTVPQPRYVDRPRNAIGIGAGKGCDGQVLVFHDLLGYHLPENAAPKHARTYVNLGGIITEAVQAFARDVRQGDFPTDAESF